MECVFCKAPVSGESLVSPFHEKYKEKDHPVGEVYAAVCEKCLKDCHEGRKTEEEFKKALGLDREDF